MTVDLADHDAAEAMAEWLAAHARWDPTSGERMPPLPCHPVLTAFVDVPDDLVDAAEDDQADELRQTRCAAIARAGVQCRNGSKYRNDVGDPLCAHHHDRRDVIVRPAGERVHFVEWFRR